MSRPKLAKLYSAPRQIDLATLLVISVAFSGLFSVLRAVSTPTLLYPWIAGFICLVAIGQVALYGGERPRWASFLVGSIIFLLLCAPQLVFMWRSVLLRDAGVLLELLFRIIARILFGGLLGYLAGALVGGTFLVADVIRQLLRRENRLDMNQE